MKIPRKFNLFGETINVKIDRRPNPSSAGESFFKNSTIVLYKSENKTREQLEQTFLHEVFHFVFLYISASDRIKLNDNTELWSSERVVDLTASLFHQVLKSGKIVK